MVAKFRSFMVALSAVLALSGMFAGVGAIHGADNLWFVTSSVNSVSCFVNANGQPTIRWKETRDWSEVPGMVDQQLATVNGQQVWEGNVLINQWNIGTLNTGYLTQTASSFPIVYHYTSKVFDPRGSLTSTTDFTMSCRLPTRAASVSLHYDKDVN